MVSPSLLDCSLLNNSLRSKTASQTRPVKADVVAWRLEKLIQCFGRGYPPSIQIPSVIDLAALYQCEILSLLASLKRLHQNAYDYRMNSLDLPLVLLDPLARFRCRKALLRRQKQRTSRGRRPTGQPTGRSGRQSPKPAPDDECEL
ncbi:hypothetical protein [Vampirovibrio chlorellavorus]|uniref:hypothetical protein n=1 Tax=Vampirovibrio chlorellavorus TaxID=758823 RepID=UPI0026F1997A|nr:hypothetical protein [Vampirovibrio chlorellavorus]